MSIVSQIVGWLRARRCAPKDDVVSYSHADAADNITYDKRNYRGGVHPYSAGREQAVADLGCVRVLAQELSAELVRTVQHGERVTIRVANSALIAVAKRAGCYIPYEDRARFGDMKRRRSGESEVYAGADYSYLVKFKDPEAKQPLKNTEPTDWLFEHVVDRYSASIRLPDNIFQSVNGKCLQVPEASGSGMATVVGGLSSADIPQPVIGKSFPPVLALTSYTNLVLISSHCRSAQEKLFYIVLAARQRLKTRELTKCLGEDAYTAILGSDRRNYSGKLKEFYPSAPLVIKDTAFLDYLSLPVRHRESKLRREIVSHIKDFILEMGKDFLFVDQEYTLPVGGEDFHSDLLFYHRGRDVCDAE